MGIRSTVYDRRTVLHSLKGVKHGGKILILHLYKLYCFLGGLFIYGRNRSYIVTNPSNPVGAKNLSVRKFHCKFRISKLSRPMKIFCRKYGLNSRKLHCLAGIY